MQDIATPTCEAIVSPELVRLLHGSPADLPGSVGAGSASEAVKGASAGASVGQAAVAAAPAPQRWCNVALRTDGRRPVRFQGLLLVELDQTAHVGDTTLHQTVRLYLTEDGSVVAQVACRPDDDMSALPLFATLPVSRPQDLAALFRHASPGACVAIATGALPSEPPVFSDTFLTMPGLAAYPEIPFKEH